MESLGYGATQEIISRRETFYDNTTFYWKTFYYKYMNIVNRINLDMIGGIQMKYTFFNHT